MGKGILWALVTSDLLALVPARFAQVKAHHLTLCYGCELNTARQALIGRSFEAQVTAEAWNDQIQALQVTLPAWVPCDNAHPHITISHRLGVAAKESNAMLDGAYESRPLALAVSLSIAFKPFKA